MNLRYIFAAVAVVLMLGYLAPIVVKLKDVPVGLVILAGLGMMAVDMWQSLTGKEA